MGHTTATFDADGWIVRVTGAAVFDRIAGPRHRQSALRSKGAQGRCTMSPPSLPTPCRLDIGFTGREGAAARGLPHGIIGQSFASSEPRYGKVRSCFCTRRGESPALAPC